MSRSHKISQDADHHRRGNRLEPNSILGCLVWSWQLALKHFFFTRRFNCCCFYNSFQTKHKKSKWFMHVSEACALLALHWDSHSYCFNFLCVQYVYFLICLCWHWHWLCQQLLLYVVKWPLANV